MAGIYDGHEAMHSSYRQDVFRDERVYNIIASEWIRRLKLTVVPMALNNHRFLLEDPPYLTLISCRTHVRRTKQRWVTAMTAVAWLHLLHATPPSCRLRVSVCERTWAMACNLLTRAILDDSQAAGCAEGDVDSPQLCPQDTDLGRKSSLVAFCLLS